MIGGSWFSNSVSTLASVLKISFLRKLGTQSSTS